jgi:hypothetical protein
MAGNRTTDAGDLLGGAEADDAADGGSAASVGNGALDGAAGSSAFGDAAGLCAFGAVAGGGAVGAVVGFGPDAGGWPGGEDPPFSAESAGACSGVHGDAASGASPPTTLGTPGMPAARRAGSSTAPDGRVPPAPAAGGWAAAERPVPGRLRAEDSTRGGTARRSGRTPGAVVAAELVGSAVLPCPGAGGGAAAAGARSCGRPAPVPAVLVSPATGPGGPMFGLGIAAPAGSCGTTTAPAVPLEGRAEPDWSRVRMFPPPNSEASTAAEASLGTVSGATMSAQTTARASSTRRARSGAAPRGTGSTPLARALRLRRSSRARALRAAPIAAPSRQRPDGSPPGQAE